uniref:Uncharacterized protein n=1 Tax=Panagrolaimus sp. JU765 TaxID=591449 RepID=A0AC34Q0L7_9BILA
MCDSRARGNFAKIYDLKNGKFHKESIFKSLIKEYPPNVVKSMFLNYHMSFDLDHDYPEWFEMVKKIGNKFGYINLHSPTTIIISATSELLFAKKQGKKYNIGDRVLTGLVGASVMFGMAFGMDFHLYLFEKQDIGWKMLNEIDGAPILSRDPDDYIEQFKTCLKNLKITLDQVKNVFLRTQSIPDELNYIFYEYIGEKLEISISRDVLKNDQERCIEYFDISGLYMAMIYAGEEYYNDYDCFIGQICEKKYQLKCGKASIDFPIQFQRLPCTIKKKIKLVECKNITLLDICFTYQKSKSKVVFESPIKVDKEIVVVTLFVDKNQQVYFKIEKNDAQKTLICSNKPLNEWKDDRPRFVFGKDHCSVNYYKNGLLWKLKDANDNIKIPFKISFDKELYIGDAAEEYEKSHLFTMDLNVLLDEKRLKEFMTKSPNFAVEDKILISTSDGIRKTSPEILFAIFIKSILKLLENKMEKSVEEIYTISKLLKIKFEALNKNIVF